ncbi:iron-containing alcohol dehydrogenase [Cupriavidus sp. D39]|uniref:iron-containing alcohol dehydrogenase n=1 Tax=Cupriavidus sp. D39 TaxID=2997877 RepID=UPI002270DB12|nr:iron-containing alcohol dehydrogenase [Cupriavidus sp. D39]MCY0854670.1 iron-containing alcohol dehydrogenase [Cupriavidus sp. D39]
MHPTQGQHHFSRQDALIWGRPAAEVVALHMQTKGLRRALIVTNRSLTDSQLLSGVKEALGAACAGVFSECTAHSPRADVLAGASQARQAGADVIVAVGGGSVIDSAKLMLACLWLNLHDDEGIDRLQAGDFADTLRGEHAVRMIAVPTTLSAAEFTHLAGVTDTRTGSKQLFEHPLYVPSLVVLDPGATRDTPDWLLASTGIRSIDHCVETLCSSRPSPYADAMALHGLKLLSQGLRSFIAEPDKPAHRLDCQLGTWLAVSGPVAGVPIGASHVIGRVLGGAFGVPHGHTSCVLLPGVLAWNASADNGRQAQIAHAMGAETNESAAAAVATLVRHLGQPGSLRDLGIQREHFSLIAEKSLTMLAHPGCDGNPRPIHSASQIFEILDLVY